VTTKNSSLWQINLTYTIVKTINKRSVGMAFWICCLSLTGMATIIISLLNGYVCISYFFVLEKRLSFHRLTIQYLINKGEESRQTKPKKVRSLTNAKSTLLQLQYDCQVPIARSQTVQCLGKCG